MTVGKLASIALDCADPVELARFWAALIGGEVALNGEDFVAVRAGSLWLAAVRTPGYRPPTWGDAATPKQMHLDVAVDDLDRAEAAAIGLGARPVADRPFPDRYRVLLDPAGHPFCLSVQMPDPEAVAT